MLATAVAVVVALGMSGTPPSPPPSTTAAASPATSTPLQRAIAAARREREALRLDRAALLLERATRRRGLSVADEVQARMWLGVAYAELGQFKRAHASFVAALERDRDAQLPADAGVLAPRVRGLFEGARLWVDPPPLPGREPAPPPPPPPAKPTTLRRLTLGG